MCSYLSNGVSADNHKVTYDRRRHRNFYGEEISPEAMGTYRMIFGEFLHKPDEIAQKRYSEIFGAQTNP